MASISLASTNWTSSSVRLLSSLTLSISSSLSRTYWPFSTWKPLTISSGSTAPMPGTVFSYLMRLPVGSWIWLSAIVAADLVAE